MKIILSLFIGLVSFTSVIQAVGLSFTEKEFKTSGKDSVRTAYVMNPSDAMLPIKIKAVAWRMTEDGQDIKTETEDFMKSIYQNV